MFETHDSWRKRYVMSKEEQFKTWYCFQLKNNRPWFYVKFAYVSDSNDFEYIFLGNEEVLRTFSEQPNIKVLQVYVVSSSDTNQTFLSQMNLLESIYTACNANNRKLKFHLYELVDGRKIAYPAENFTENLDDVNLVYTTLDRNPLNIPL